MSEPLRIYIGWDSREPLTFSVLAHSILTRASRPVALIPLTRASLGHHYTRPRGSTEATEFSLTRFMVPFLSGYRGTSIFMDCDMICRVDINDVLLHVVANPQDSVFCCQHDYVPRERTKFLGQQQTTYPRKNWSSFMVFNNAKCTTLTPDYVNQATGLELHRMHWAGSIGAIPFGWNWLVDEYDPNPDAKILHFTNGAPCFPGFEACGHAADWWQEYSSMLVPAKAVAQALALPVAP